MAAFVWFVSLDGISNASAKGIRFIRDAEIERTIRIFATPVFEAAGLDPTAVKVYIVNDNGINAFVAGGQKLFINSGLLKQSDNAGQAIGVIAHEAGHIAGGHLIRTHEALSNASAKSILGYVLGGAAAIATGRGDLASAIILGGQHIGARAFLKYSRGQEAAADQAAMTYLDEIGASSKGLSEFFDKLAGQELLSVGRQSAYVRTHPLSRDRIAAVEDHVQKSPYTSKALPERYEILMNRMRGKLRGFTDSIVQTLRRYPKTDQSVEARYARAIAYYRRPDLDRALPLIDSLLAEAPDDPFFLELKGQMLFENGRLTEALDPYEKAVRNYPSSGLLRADLARVQIELGDPAYLEDAIGHLRVASRVEPNRAFNWRLLAIAQGRSGDTAGSALSLAHEALLQGRKPDARFHAGKAEGLFPRGSPGWLQAEDILNATRKKKKK